VNPTNQLTLFCFSRNGKSLPLVATTDVSEKPGGIFVKVQERSRLLVEDAGTFLVQTFDGTNFPE